MSRPHETVTPVEDGVVKEVNYVIREWNPTWKRLYVVRIHRLKSDRFVVYTWKLLAV